MTHIIKQAAKQVRVFQVGQQVKWTKMFHDGRGYENWDYAGEIVKVNKVTVDVLDAKGNTWRVNKREIN